MHKTLLLYSFYTDSMSYFDDWIDAFREHKDYGAHCVNVFAPEISVRDIHKKIGSYDLIILHHSMSGDTLKYIMPFLSALKQRKGKLVAFVGNEVNLPTIGMAPKIKILQDLEPDIIATQLLQEAGEWLYQDCKKSKVLSLPHALNPKIFFSTKNLADRKIDVGTRSARYGVYIGDFERNSILQYFQNNAQDLGLSVDLGLEIHAQKRFNRSQWSSFLSACKATLSTEAGSFYLERDDQLVTQIENFLRCTSNKIVLPNETKARNIYRKLVPSMVRKIIIYLLKERLVEVDRLDEETDFQKIYEKFFLKAQKCPVYSKAISSRHFDAIGTKTLHVMYPGRYNDILLPGKHYFELKRDHSNIEELIEFLKDFEGLRKITENTQDYVLSNHTHKNRLDLLFKALV